MFQHNSCFVSKWGNFTNVSASLRRRVFLFRLRTFIESMSHTLTLQFIMCSRRNPLVAFMFSSNIWTLAALLLFLFRLQLRAAIRRGNRFFVSTYIQTMEKHKTPSSPKKKFNKLSLSSMFVSIKC